jgi:hypothetical protein
MGIDDDDAVVPTPPPPKPVASAVQSQAQRRHTNTRSLQQLPYYLYRGVNDDPEYSGSSSRICLHKMMLVPRSRSSSSELLQKMRQDLQAWQASKAIAQVRRTCAGRRWPGMVSASVWEDTPR